MRTSNIQKYSFLFVAVLMAFQVSAQKFGYVNSTLILSQHPEVKAADAELEAYQKQLVSKGEQMVAAFEKSYTAYMTASNQGTLSAIQAQEAEAKLTKEQQAIQSYEQEIQEKLYNKRETLYKPILDKVNMTLETMGKDEGYTMIFDSSAGALLHAAETQDLTAKLRAKLGF